MHLDLLFLFLLILINAFFVASETALIGTRKTRLTEIGKKSRIPKRLIDVTINNLNHSITATQLGSTLTSIAVGWRGQLLFNNLIHNGLSTYVRQYPFLNSPLFSSVIPFFTITLLLMVFGELVPKRLSIYSPERSLLLFITPLSFFSRLFKPIIHFINLFTDAILRPFGKHHAKKETPFSEEEIRIIITESVRNGIIPQSLKSLVYNALRLRKVRSGDIMIPKRKVTSFRLDESLAQVQKTMKEKNLTFLRYLVSDSQKRELIGFFELSHFFIASLRYDQKITLKDSHVIKKALSIDYTDSADIIFAKMVLHKIFIAIVYRKGRSCGVISINQISTQLVQRFD